MKNSTSKKFDKPNLDAKVQTIKYNANLEKFLNLDEFDVIVKTKKPKLRLFIFGPENFNDLKLINKKLTELLKYYEIAEIVDIGLFNSIIKSFKNKKYKIYPLKLVFPEAENFTNVESYLAEFNNINKKIINYSNYFLGFIPKDSNLLDNFCINIVKQIRETNKNHQLFYY